MSLLYTRTCMLNFITEYSNNSYLTWNSLMKKYSIKSRTTFMRKIYELLEDPYLVSDTLFYKVQKKSLYISNAYHKDSIQKIENKFEKICIERRKKMEASTNCDESTICEKDGSMSILQLNNLKASLIFQIESFSSNETDSDEISLSELEKRLEDVERQLELAKRYTQK